MALDIHPLMENANDIDARVQRAVKDHVSPAWILAIARADGICGPA
jgi:hypothetical protein